MVTDWPPEQQAASAGRAGAAAMLISEASRRACLRAGGSDKELQSLSEDWLPVSHGRMHAHPES
jgi:hypothetical protein